MASISQVEIDHLIISFVKVDWRKTAFVIAKVLHDCDAKDISIKAEEIFDRILSLQRRKSRIARRATKLAR
jgi:hypothetical protein